VSNSYLVYGRSENPWGHPWEEWVERWCQWMFSIPVKENPTTDYIGRYCSKNQEDENVWFLTGTFGNIRKVRRRCRIPSRKAILFPVLEKEDSFAEDLDLRKEAELIQRCADAMNRVTYVEAYVDGQPICNLYDYRVRSKIFSLTFPKENVYSVKPGPTSSVCDGYWVFLRPLTRGKHVIEFAGETSLLKGGAVEEQLRSDKVYARIWNQIKRESIFRLDISYDLTVVD
jgi:hypothetical protein